MSTRYFYYLLWQNMVVNVVVFVPNILIAERFNGAVLAVLAAIPIGMVLLLAFVKAISKMPGQTVPQILEQALPKGLAKVFTFYFSTYWMIAGALTLMAYSEIAYRYIMPDTSKWQILVLFALPVVLAAGMRSQAVLIGLEVIIVLNIPFVAFLMIKSFINEEFNWWAVRDIATHVFELPSLKAISGATFIFSGYANMAVFNEVIHAKLKGLPHVLLVGLSGFTTLVTTFLIPIGYHGTNAVGHYVFPWVITADSLRLEFFFIERVLFIFLLLYMMIALVNSIVSWHASMKMMGSVIRLKRGKEIVLAVFVLVLFAMNWLLNSHFDVSRIAEMWLVLRFFSEIVFVGIVIFAVRRVQKPT